VKLQKFGHSCLLVTSGDARLLFDPGSFSRGFESVEGLTAILVTHQHADHLDLDRLPALVERNPEAALVCDAESADQLRGAGLEPTVARPGDELQLGCPVVVGGGQHAVIHPDLPRITNNGYLVDKRFWHPGDALVSPETDVELLALPAVAPWMRIADAIDFYRAVAPRTAVPIHEAVAAVPQLYYGMLERLGPQQSQLRVIDDGEPAQL
jgi:L-ascorbate metabolism protein UlaG (beta-lactamase superfamily)